MWISILNYELARIDVFDMSDYKVDEKANFDNNQIAEKWLDENGYEIDEVQYLLTDEHPICVVNGVKFNLKL